MKIIETNLFRYKFPLKSPLKLESGSLNFREGLLVQLTDENGIIGLGETAPLPGFSDETIKDAEIQCGIILKKIRTTTLPDRLLYPHIDLEELLSNTYPSIQFGIETAIVDLVAQINKQSISKYLNDLSAETIFINGLLSGEKKEILHKAAELRAGGYKAVKLKVGWQSIDDDIALTCEVRKTIGNEMSLRLDSNRSWHLDDARKFCNEVSGLNIEYLEEPLADPSQLVTALNNGEFAIPIALDETLREIFPAELHTFDAVDALVIKPTLLGLFKSLRFAHQAKAQGITPVISSSYESTVGLTILAHIAAAVDSGITPMGLDTQSLFADDIMQISLPVNMGKININSLPDTHGALNSGQLGKVEIA